MDPMFSSNQVVNHQANQNNFTSDNDSINERVIDYDMTYQNNESSKSLRAKQNNLGMTNDSDFNYSMTLKSNKLANKSGKKPKELQPSLSKKKSIGCDDEDTFERDSGSGGRGVFSGEHSHRNPAA